MDIKELGRFDLNLLVALQVLLEERNVSNAAERLFVTQSAMSKTLGRLRELFDDPLFTRTATGMLPTPRAEQIATYLPKILQGVQCIVQPQDFDPATYQGEFSIVLPEYIASWILPSLFDRLDKIAPGIRLNTLSGEEHHLDMLANGELDFAVQIEHHVYSADFKVMSLGFAPPRLIARIGHPLENKKIHWEDIARYPLIQLHIPDRDESLFIAQPGSPFLKFQLETEPHLTTEHLFVALQVLCTTNHIFVGPPLFAELDDLSTELITLPMPDEEEIMLKYVIVYHDRIAESAAHQFLFQQFVECIDQHRLKNDLPSLEEMRKIRGLAY